jgi:hypothetical protein
MSLHEKPPAAPPRADRIIPKSLDEAWWGAWSGIGVKRALVERRPGGEHRRMRRPGKPPRRREILVLRGQAKDETAAQSAVADR